MSASGLPVVVHCALRMGGVRVRAHHGLAGGGTLCTALDSVRDSAVAATALVVAPAVLVALVAVASLGEWPEYVVCAGIAEHVAEAGRSMKQTRCARKDASTLHCGFVSLLICYI